jgi:hypothetical protein
LASFGVATREGHLEVTSFDFEKLTGQQARDLETVLR